MCSTVLEWVTDNEENRRHYLPSVRRVSKENGRAHLPMSMVLAIDYYVYGCGDRDQELFGGCEEA